MRVLSTRVLNWSGAGGAQNAVALTIFAPFEIGQGDWKCVFGFDPPIKPVGAGGRGPDFLGAIVHGLAFARLFLETMPWWASSQWQGLHDCGLPASGEKVPAHPLRQVPLEEPNPGGLVALSARTLGRPSDNGETSLTLLVFEPLQDGNGWKCPFAFGTSDGPIRYGYGVDYIESLLDALSLSRVIYEADVPKEWEPHSPGLLGCADFPVKVGRSFWT